MIVTPPYPPSGLSPNARLLDWQIALQMWARGKDTLDIARHFQVHESTIYNFLPRSKLQRIGQ
jgi:transposase